MITQEEAEMAVAELEAGVPIDVVRAKYSPELHHRIMEEEARKAAKLHQPRVPSPPVWGYVYIFAAGPLIKIGMSEVGVAMRWRTIRTGNPLLEDPPLYVSPPLGNRARSIERAVHNFLQGYRETGEWFRCDRELAIKAVQQIVKEHGYG